MVLHPPTRHLNAQYLDNLGVAIVVNSYNEFKNILLNVINDYEGIKREMFNNVNIQIGNNEITRYSKRSIQ